MLPTPTPPVKPTAHALIRQLGYIALALAVALGTTWALGLDAKLARALYAPESAFAHASRQYGALATGLVAWLALPLLFWPRLNLTRPLLYRSAAILVLTAALGAGVANQLVVKHLADRPRPRESVLAAPAEIMLPDDFKGNSMPSGHAGQAFVLMAPYFVLRRRKPMLANLVLAGGAFAGAAVGLGRMLAGAHFFTDVLAAGGIALLVAAALAPLLERGAIPRRWLLLALVAAPVALVAGNHFTAVLTYEARPPWHRIDLPCPLVATPAPVAHPTLRVAVTGYGAPLTQLNLFENQGIIRLSTGFGLFHHLTCAGELLTPAE